LTLADSLKRGLGRVTTFPFNANVLLACRADTQHTEGMLHLVYCDRHKSDAFCGVQGSLASFLSSSGPTSQLPAPLSTPIFGSARWLDSSRAECARSGPPQCSHIDVTAHRHLPAAASGRILDSTIYHLMCMKSAPKASVVFLRGLALCP